MVVKGVGVGGGLFGCGEAGAPRMQGESELARKARRSVSILF